MYMKELCQVEHSCIYTKCWRQLMEWGLNTCSEGWIQGIRHRQAFVTTQCFLESWHIQFHPITMELDTSGLAFDNLHTLLPTWILIEPILNAWVLHLSLFPVEGSCMLLKLWGKQFSTFSSVSKPLPPIVCLAWGTVWKSHWTWICKFPVCLL